MTLFHKKDLIVVYGFTSYEAQTIMERLPKINIGRGEFRPRWVVKQEDVEAYLNRKAQRSTHEGLDCNGKLLRR